jgi:hypothetical protein
MEKLHFQWASFWGAGQSGFRINCEMTTPTAVDVIRTHLIFLGIFKNFVPVADPKTTGGEVVYSREQQKELREEERKMDLVIRAAYPKRYQLSVEQRE